MCSAVGGQVRPLRSPRYARTGTVPRVMPAVDVSSARIVLPSVLPSDARYLLESRVEWWRPSPVGSNPAPRLMNGVSRLTRARGCDWVRAEGQIKQNSACAADWSLKTDGRASAPWFESHPRRFDLCPPPCPPRDKKRCREHPCRSPVWALARYKLHEPQSRVRARFCAWWCGIAAISRCGRACSETAPTARVVTRQFVARPGTALWPAPTPR